MLTIIRWWSENKKFIGYIGGFKFKLHILTNRNSKYHVTSLIFWCQPKAVKARTTSFLVVDYFNLYFANDMAGISFC